MLNRLLTAAVAGVVALALVVPSQAGFIYNHGFDGSFSSNLAGTAVDFRDPLLGGTSATWTGSTAFKADGAIIGGATGNTFRSVKLGFTPTSGKIYTLAITLDRPTGTQWVGFGFAGSASQLPNFEGGGAGAGAAWMTYRTNGAILSYYTDNTATGVNQGTYAGTKDLAVKLDTTGALWNLEYFIDGNSVRTVSGVSPMTVSQIRIEQIGDATLGFESGVSSFSLSAVPEPGSLAVVSGLVACISVLSRRRRQG
jgi:hypothetical protein